MKLVRFGQSGLEKPGILDHEHNIRDLSEHVSDICAQTINDGVLEQIKALAIDDLPIVKGSPRFGPCVGNVGKFMCIGLNYHDHAEETGAKVPEHPILFMKANSAIIGANDDVYMARSSTKTDWEVELGVVIGKRAKYVSKAQALDYVAGYCVCNDLSERHFQKQMSGLWTKGKSCDTYGPIGPWLVSKDEIADPHHLDMHLDVNGQRMQTGNTKTMIFGVDDIIAHLSQLFTLYPGDIIATGTPPGVGLGMRPERYLKVGDVVELAIEGLGRQCQHIKQDR